MRTVDGGVIPWFVLLCAIFLPAWADDPLRDPGPEAEPAGNEASEPMTITLICPGPLVRVDETTVEETLAFEFLEEIPTGRSYFDAVEMVAGIAGSASVHTRSPGSSFHAHGADDTDNVFLIDGVEATNNATSDFGMNLPFEAISEVIVRTAAFGAEYGRATGAIIEVVTRSGGNEFHGSVPVYYTNLDLKRHQWADRGAIWEDDWYEMETGASLGGPVIRDKLWFFAAYNRFVHRITGINSSYQEVKVSDLFEEWMGKLTWQANAQNSFVAQYMDSPSEFDSTPWHSVDPSAYEETRNGGSLWQLEWTSMFTPNLFLETRLARQLPYLFVGPANADPHDDRFTDYHNGESDYTIYGNTSSTTDIDWPRLQYSTTLNLYRGDMAGEHQFKFGAEYQDFEYEEDSIYPNSYVINRPNGLPDQWFRTSDLHAVNDGSILTFFAQDSWTWRDDWTFNLGLRWETQEQNNDVGEQVYSLDNLIAPRVGFAWDVRGDGRSKIFAHYGRYFDAVGTYLGQALNRLGSESWYYEGDYETGDWYCLMHTSPDDNPTQVDPDLDPSFKDEVVAGYEFEFASDFSAGIRGIYNWQDNRIEDVIGNEAAIRAGEETEYWFYITNIPSAKRDYKGVELELNKRLSRNYQFLLAYTLSWARGSVANAGQAEGMNVYGDFAEVKFNRYGYLPWDDRHFLKLNGSYHLPWGIVAGTSCGWRSGRPYNRIGNLSQWPEDDGYHTPFDAYGTQFYIDPRGSHRLGHVWWIDLRLAKEFAIGDTDLSLIVEAFNVTNNQLILGRQEMWARGPDDGDDANWGRATGWMEAGKFVVGVRYAF